MARCSNCKAPLSSGSLICDYCGSRNDIDLQGTHYHTTHEHDTPRICPRCTVPLVSIDLKVNNRFLIDRCEHCMGLFFDPNELETLLEASATNVYLINHTGLNAITSDRQAPTHPIMYIKCPVCSQLMNRVNFGAKSGVIVDRCKEHGVWLDGGELRQLMEWMKLGGKLLDQERREQERQEAIKRERDERLKLAVGDELSPFDRFGGPLRDSDPDLFSIILKTIRLIF